MPRALAAGDPARIGPYDIRAVLGEGGMGVVYRAEQTAPVRRPVALKLVRAGTASRDIVARFQAERQSLAVMEHPGIAKVFDGGNTPAGDPFFVMELVEGQPLTDYCDTHRLTTRQRLEIFTEICDAVQHAHQKGVIHRDLKPSNVLVTGEAGARRAKVIDFGIAKAIGDQPDAETATNLTRAGAVIGTPAYMSPEQAAGSRLDVDTRSDVYSLGVMLYELLCGLLPVDPGQIGFLPFLHQLLERKTTPPVPSARVTGTDARSSEVAARRQTDARRLTSELRGDLDVIVMKALDVDRERRYPSPQALAADVTRFLRDEPIEARPPSRTYLARKFVQRNRGLAVAAGIAVFALVGGATASAVGLVRAVRAEGNARTAQARAELEAATSKQVSDFLVDLFGRANPGRTRGETVTAKQLLEAGAISVDQRLADQPAVQGRLYLTMGRAYEGLGLWNPAVDLYRRSLAVREQARGPDHPDVAESLALLAHLLQYQRGAGDPEAASMIERALRIRTVHRAENVEGWLSAFGAYGELLENTGRRAEAERLYQQEQNAADRAGGPNDPVVVAMHDQLAASYFETGRNAEAIRLWTDLLARRRAESPPDGDTIATLSTNLALAYSNVGRPDDAVAMYAAAVDALKAAHGTDKPDPALANIYWNMASTYGDLNRLAEAEAAWTAYLDLSAQLYGPNDPQILPGLLMVASLQLERGRFAEAQATADRGLRIAIPAATDPRRGGSDHGDVVVFWEKYGRAVAGQMSIENAIRNVEARAGGTPDQYMSPLYRMARALWLDEQQTDALTVLRRIVSVRESTHGQQNHPILLQHLARLAAALDAVGQTGEATTVRARARAVVESNLATQPADAPLDVWQVLCRWGALSGNARTALAACDRAVAAADADTRWQSLDLRALARGILGDLSGAKADLEAYVGSTGPAYIYIDERKQWLQEIAGGKNPYTDVVIGDYRFPA